MSTEKKLTAVEWLVEHLTEYGFNLKLHKAEIQQAKEKEKQNIIETVEDIMCDMNLYESFRSIKNGEQYYNETFKN